MPGPYLILAAFWSDSDCVEAVADALDPERFDRSDKTRAAVVSFALATTEQPGFGRVMERLDLAELNDRPPAPG